eukprot:gnl/TRDRNA2_/TRDRNA2_86126_c0_seq3.p1 gnl/TRDRNA2_/TRDRNA2_86126_c0~~gnl/TRDRNA2_/TRDRNA2_86126_c0_seq3.p1  ORF type:complete len:551 (-),score=112.65 gnl/TRDRNA2_/TRDRNA2_86126_c0_seq3:175-1767(-)
MSAEYPDAPLVEVEGPRASSARFRLRGPRDLTLPEEFRSVLTRVPTTINDTGSMRFGDSLLVLSYGSQVPLQSDISRQVQVVDEHRAQSKSCDAFCVTTGKVLHPCARNSFSVVRADRNDGYGDDLDVHYGQSVRILASSFLCEEILYVYLEANSTSSMSPVFLTKASSPAGTFWRIVPTDQPSDPVERVAHRRAAVAQANGMVVHVNQKVALEHVSTGRVLMSDVSLVNTGFGLECRVFAADRTSIPHLRGKLGPDEPCEMSVVHTAWSFVNDDWADRVEERELARTGGQNYKEDQGDDFLEKRRKQAEKPDHPVLLPLKGAERKQQENLISRLSQSSSSSYCQRIFQLLRAGGTHSVRKIRRMCVGADVSNEGSLPMRVFEGIIATRPFARLQPAEVAALQKAFATAAGPDAERIDYKCFFEFMEGIMPDLRVETVRKAYRKLELHADGGFVTIDYLMDMWHEQCCKEVIGGQLEPKEAYQEFFSQWEVADSDGIISPEEFMRYYRDVSMTYEDTGEFCEMMRVAWDL